MDGGAGKMVGDHHAHLTEKKIFKGFIQKNLLKKMINKFALLKKTEKCTQLYLYTGNKQKDILEF